jgi:hypothetical protein
MRKAAVVVLVLTLGCGREREPVETPTESNPGALRPSPLPTPVTPGNPTNPIGAFTVDATVEFVGIEGGCWTLKTSSKTYFPLDLPAGFREHGISVRANVTVQDNVATTCMIGQPVNINSITRR